MKETKITTTEAQVSDFLRDYLVQLQNLEFYHLGEEEEGRLLSLLHALKALGPPWRELQEFVIVLLYYGTKLTAAEIVRLRTENVVESAYGLLALEIATPSGGQRHVSLDPPTSMALLTYLEERPDGFLFADEEGGRRRARDVHHLLETYPHLLLMEKLAHYYPIYSEKDYEVIPIRLRLNADHEYTGRGITIAFIDSGFFPHPDLTKPRNRILEYVNIAEPGKADFAHLDETSWHGMQTSVVAAGNGYLSNGLYKGIAWEADVVLLKVSGPRGIETANVIKALEWVIKHKEEYNIRIVNLSISGDRVSSYLDNALDQAAEGAVQAGITVVVAAGNSGGGRWNAIHPPASAPSVITVGGLDDKNTLDVARYQMYWSSYGPTVDGLLKPELIAPGIWIAAPLLPGSSLQQEAEALERLRNAPDAQIGRLFTQLRRVTKLPPIPRPTPRKIRQAVERRVKEEKLVHAHYQHVDGTSFSAPIVCSVIAQMIEANRYLTPRRIKEILTKTTDKVYGVPIEQQGHGLIHARKAVKEAWNDLHRTGVRRPSSPYVHKGEVFFYFQHRSAHSVALAGDFNDWNPHREFLVKQEPDLWMTKRTFSKSGCYSYKFVVNGTEWVTDPENGNREPDGYGGFNTRVNVIL